MSNPIIVERHSDTVAKKAPGGARPSPLGGSSASRRKGPPESLAALAAAEANFRTLVAKERARLTLPASADEAAKLAGHYVNAALGNITVKRSGAKTMFAWDGGESQMATRKNDDGTISFVTADPPLTGLEFVNAEREGKRCLILRDAQHEYVFTEAS